MKLIPLTKGQFTQVDDEDYDFLMQWSWYAQYCQGKYYPTRGYCDPRINNMSKIRMHNQIMNPPKGMLVDHIDRNPLNNQKINLRLANVYQNSRNKTPKKNGTSKYLGVHLVTCYNKSKTIKYNYWATSIYHNGKVTNLGKSKYTEEGEILAAKRYDDFAKKHYGEFANLNFKQKSRFPGLYLLLIFNLTVFLYRYL